MTHTAHPSSTGVLIADTSGLIAAFDNSCPESDAAFQALEKAGLVVLSPLVLAELDHVGRALGPTQAQSMIEDLTTETRLGTFEVAAITTEVLEQANAMRRLYADLNLDLADSIGATLAADYETDAILTLDHRDFRALTPLTQHDAFRLLPADL